MRIGVEIDRVFGPREPRNHPKIGLVAGREHDAVFTAEEACKLLLQLAVYGIGAVCDPRARRASAMQSKRLLPRCNAVGIEGDAHIVIGAGEHRFAPLDYRARWRQYPLVDWTDGIGTKRQHAFM